MNIVDRHIHIDPYDFTVNLNEPVTRFDHNPIINADQVNKVWAPLHRKVVTVHNAGISRYRGEVVMLFRSHLRNGISVIGLARSLNGFGDWKIEPEPAMMPCSENDLFGPGVDPVEQVENEAGGVEDPRISLINGVYYITYSAYHWLLKDRVRVCLATTTDFKTFTRHGPVLDRDMRNVVIFPEKIGGRYVALMRPNDLPDGDHTGGIFKEIRIACSDDILSGKWEVDPDPVMKQEGGPSAFGDKIGPGATPMKTDRGWISIFHGVRSTMDGNPYVLGVALHDPDDPRKVRVSNIPILFPSKADCRIRESGYIHVPQVVFSCGGLVNDDGSVLIYYGGNDTVMNVGVSHVDVLFELCNSYQQDPLTGAPMYGL